MYDAADLLERWAVGWANVRGVPVREVEPGLRVDVNAASRRTEFVVPRPTSALVERLAAQVAGRQDVWVTLDAGAAREIAEATAGLELVSTVEALMTRTLVPEADAPEVELAVGAGHTTARIEVDGQTAASGAVGVDGTDAFFDRIETGAAFRRRGHGSQVMRALSAGRSHAARPPGSSRPRPTASGCTTGWAGRWSAPWSPSGAVRPRGRRAAPSLLPRPAPRRCAGCRTRCPPGR